MNIAFNASQVAPEQTPEPLPLDWYPVTITDSEQKETAEKTGAYLQLTLKVQAGHPFAGREQRYNLNLWNQNQTAVTIAFKQLSAICHVTGQINLQDTRQLNGIPFQAKIGPQKNNSQYSEVKAVKDAQGNDPGKQQSAPAPVQQPVQAAPQYAPPAQPIVATPAAAQWGAPAQVNPIQGQFSQTATAFPSNPVPVQTAWSQAPTQQTPPWATK
jgi:hypothetical protein